MKRLLLAGLLVLAAQAAVAQDEVGAFLARHWAFPIPAQKKAPESYGALEASLNPDSCGQCHPKQYAGWRASRHARAMGPGVMGQLLAVEPDAVGELRACTSCHAPLAEQEKTLETALRGETRTGALHERGLVCAGCHVRGNVRYGPPPLQPLTGHAHGGFVISRAFEDGRFCATCHQFGKDGYVLNGKPLENTYAEWRASPYAKQKVQCQGCHMPGRQHLWRGIHDPKMTESAVTIDAVAPSLREGSLHARLVMTNSGAGHDFPTYVTPQVLVQIYQEDASGKLLVGTLRQRMIARQVSADLSKELADTRLAPGATMSLYYRVPLSPSANALIMRVIVEPDHFYTGLYRALQTGKNNARGAALIRTALKNSMRSEYDLYSRRFMLPSNRAGCAKPSCRRGAAGGEDCRHR